MSQTPLTAVVAQLISALTTYLTYQDAVQQARQNNTSPPPAPDAAIVQQAEQIRQTLHDSLQQHGDEYERADLANYEQAPQRYHEFMIHMVSGIATRRPDFAAQLRQLATQLNAS
jgi:GTP cyclohydrolase I